MQWQWCSHHSSVFSNTDVSGNWNCDVYVAAHFIYHLFCGVEVKLGRGSPVVSCLWFCWGKVETGHRAGAPSGPPCCELYRHLLVRHTSVSLLTLFSRLFSFISPKVKSWLKSAVSFLLWNSKVTVWDRWEETAAENEPILNNYRCL